MTSWHWLGLSCVLSVALLLELRDWREGKRDFCLHRVSRWHWVAYQGDPSLALGFLQVGPWVLSWGYR